MLAADNPELGADAEELVAIVDEATNEVTGSARRADMRKGNLPHRATYVFIKLPGGEPANPVLWVQKRTMIKDYCPGSLDPTAGGVVGYGEEYSVNARRELAEEMGIVLEEDDTLVHCFSFHYKDQRTNVWGDVWECEWAGEIVPQESEVETVHQYTVKELVEGKDKEGNTLEVTPDGVVALQKYASWLEGQAA